MHIESGRVTWVGETYQRIDKRTGTPDYYRDFVVQWHDNHAGRLCSLKFTVCNKMNVIENISRNMFVSLDFQLEAREWNGKYFNNTRILGDTLHCVAKKG